MHPHRNLSPRSHSHLKHSLSGTAHGSPWGLTRQQNSWTALTGRGDQADVAATVPLLDPTQRRWLFDTVRHLHPAHPWLDHL
jgi:hypothetical protein